MKLSPVWRYSRARKQKRNWEPIEIPIKYGWNFFELTQLRLERSLNLSLPGFIRLFIFLRIAQQRKLGESFTSVAEFGKFDGKVSLTDEICAYILQI